MYLFDGRIRYSEVDSEGKLSLRALLNYFQDCSTFHSEDLGVGTGYLQERHLVWVLSAWQIVVERYPRLCERVRIGTLPYEFKGFVGMRNFVMLTPKGTYLARANSLWSLLNADTGKPAQITEAMREAYVLEEKLPMDYTPRKIPVPEGGGRRDPIVVKKHHLDTNRHVNNGQYVDMALAFVPDGFVISRMRAEYRKQAFLEDVLYPYVVAESDRHVISLTDAQGRPYVIVEFSGMEAIC